MNKSRKQIMTSANLRAKSEGRSQSLKNSHRANKGVLVCYCKVVKTLAQRSRVESNFKPSEKIKDTELLLDFDMGMI